MSTTVIVFVAIWNGLLLAGLLAVILWRKQLPRWITGLDGRNRNHWESVQERDAWTAFLAEHPELLEPEGATAAEHATGRNDG